VVTVSALDELLKHAATYKATRSVQGRMPEEEYKIMMLAFRAVDEVQVEVARLRHALDVMASRKVVYCMDRNMDEIILGESLSREGDGTILRATDTGRELELRGGAWLPR
jgi:hypothetical protein